MGSISVAIVRKRVDLPQPEVPVMAIAVFCGRVMERLDRIGVVLYPMARFLIWSTVVTFCGVVII